MWPKITILEFKLPTFLHIPDFIFIHKYIKLASVFLQKLCNQNAFYIFFKKAKDLSQNAAKAIVWTKFLNLVAEMSS